MIFEKIRESKVLNHLVVILSTAYIFLFFSEYYFVNEGPAFGLIDGLTDPMAGLLQIIGMILWYFFFTYIFFIAIDKFDVNNIWTLFLAGALYGWWTEGIAISVMYELLPITIIWTSLGWHALIDVMIGWYLVRKTLHRNNYLHTLLLSTALGLFWGIWATWFWVEDVDPLLPSNFILYSMFTSSLLILAYYILDRTNLAEFKMSTLGIVIYSFISILFFIFLSLSLGFIPFLVLPPLVGVTFVALWRNKQMGNGSNILSELDGETNNLNYLILFFIPLTASLTYFIVYSMDLNIPITEIIPFILLPGGFVMYLASMFRAMK